MKQKIKDLYFVLVFLVVLGQVNAVLANSASSSAQHVLTKDYKLVEDAFLHGFTHNLVNEKVGDKKLTTFTVGCVWDNKHAEDVSIDRPFFSVWTRDLYWGAKGS